LQLEEGVQSAGSQVDRHRRGDFITPIPRRCPGRSICQDSVEIMAKGWSTDEIEATVAAYFAMLQIELAGLSYNKSQHNEALRRVLQGRTKAAVEYKFQNISAVLVNFGYVYVKGYLPAQNYQLALEARVLEWLQSRPDFAKAVRTSPLLNPDPPDVLPSFAAILTDPPEPGRAARTRPSFLPAKVDFQRLDAENRALGTRGEEFVFELERRRLHDDEGRADLAKRVRWRARDDGDGLGYDILSFEAGGAERLIEVKTTGAGKYVPFAVTRNELACSQQNAARFQLYRLYEFGASPRLYVLRGALDQACALEPTQFRALVRRP
jgi:hypothetical protein